MEFYPSTSDQAPLETCQEIRVAEAPPEALRHESGALQKMNQRALFAGGRHWRHPLQVHLENGHVLQDRMTTRLWDSVHWLCCRHPEIGAGSEEFNHQTDHSGHR